MLEGWFRQWSMAGGIEFISSFTCFATAQARSRTDEGNAAGAPKSLDAHGSRNSERLASSRKLIAQSVT